MGIKVLKPRTNGRRHMTAFDFAELTKSTPEKSLTEAKHRTGARNNRGRITIRHVGGGHRQRYRLVDFKRGRTDTPAVVKAIEYDPNRTCRIALIYYQNGEKSYILCPVGLSVGDQVLSSERADIKPGNCLPLGSIPTGTLIHNVEMRPGKGGQMARGAGVGATLVAKLGPYCQVKLPSGEVRQVLSTCRASIGQVGNPEHENVKSG